MNHLQGTVRRIDADRDICLIEILVGETSISALTVNRGFQQGDDVSIAFKDTAMSIGKHVSGEFSIRNRFPLIITAVTVERVLTKVALDFGGTPLVSTITTASAERMQLKAGDRVEGLVKTTDMHLTKG